MKSHWNKIRVSPYEIDTWTCQDITLYFLAFIMLKVHLSYYELKLSIGVLLFMWPVQPIWCPVPGVPFSILDT